MKTLILFSYYENNTKGNVSRIENLYFFLKKGLIDNPDYHYIFIINGKKLSVNIPQLRNVEIRYRDNIDYDFGAYSDVLLDIDYTKYKFFIFINDSVRGPLFPFWLKCDWVDLFTSQITETTKLFGATMNFYRGNPHINSEMFLTDISGIKILIENKIFVKKRDFKNFSEVVQMCEVKQSQVILNSGYNIGCLMEAYKNIDFRKYRGKEYENNRELNANFRYGGDPLFKNSYFGVNVHPYEVIFFKNNRGIDDNLINLYSKWQLK